MTKADGKVLGYPATPSRASWWLSAPRFFKPSPKSRQSAGNSQQTTGIITARLVSKELAPIDKLTKEKEPCHRPTLSMS
jgi:hypothetical protein